MSFKRIAAIAVVAFAGTAFAADNKVTNTPAGVSLSPKATYACSNESFGSDTKVGWDGFLTGLRGFEHFYEPIGNPIYFESPFNYTGVRFLFLRHTFADRSQLQGGDLMVYAMQARVALTERLTFIATKDGYSDLSANLLPDEKGWNDIAAGLKYAFFVDRENDYVCSAGFRYQIDTGEKDVLQGNVSEFSPFVSAAKGYENKMHAMACVTARVPMNQDDGNTVIQWDLHGDWEVSPESLPGFAPMVELHGLHYVTDGERLGLSVGGLDYANLGSTDVAGSFVLWLGAGFRWKFTPNLSLGADYEYPLTNRNADIFGDRFTFDFTITW